MLIVSDTSPITNLIRIGELELLQKLFGQVIIPQKVYDELAYYERQQEELDREAWVVVRTVTNLEKIEELNEVLDEGEAEAIVLAEELNADFLIIDERKGRKVAEDYGLRIVGLLGILIQAKQKGYIRELKPILDRLINEIGFRVSRQLYNGILSRVGE
ncbi:MAG: DUF3368 domain-containing protein [Chitinophagales bacterium]